MVAVSGFPTVADIPMLMTFLLLLTLPLLLVFLLLPVRFL
jgi:hypothetical protein